MPSIIGAEIHSGRVTGRITSTESAGNTITCNFEVIEVRMTEDEASQMRDHPEMKLYFDADMVRIVPEPEVSET